MKKQLNMQLTSYAPLIEFHGFVHSDVMKLKKTIPQELQKLVEKKKILQKDYENFTFHEISGEVKDISGNTRPFIRMYSSEHVLVHLFADILKNLKWSLEVEFIKITHYMDLRPKK